MHLDEFDLYVSKEIKRPRVWVKIKKGEDYTEITCRAASQLGKAAGALFSSIDQYSKPVSEDVKRVALEHVQILREIGASERVIANAEKTAENFGAFVPKPNK